MSITQWTDKQVQMYFIVLLAETNLVLSFVRHKMTITINPTAIVSMGSRVCEYLWMIFVTIKLRYGCIFINIIAHTHIHVPCTLILLNTSLEPIFLPYLIASRCHSPTNRPHWLVMAQYSARHGQVFLGEYVFCVTFEGQ